MAFSLWLKQPSVVRQIAVWGVEVARRSHARVAVRLSEAIYAMNLAEARGYIRARSAPVVEEEIAFLKQQTNCEPALAEAVHRRAFEELIRLGIGDLLKAARRPLPARKAA